MNRETLDSEHYFESLVEAAQKEEILSDTDVESLQLQCIDLLACQTERYNAGKGNSIRFEKAQSILASIMFTLGVCLKTYPDPSDAASALLREPLSGIYQRGRKRIDALLSETRLIQSRLLRKMLRCGNIFYRSTIEEGINGFFKLYDPDFEAQEIHITADYPLCIPRPCSVGVEFMREYIEAAYYENLFCVQFEPDTVLRLLRGYEASYQTLLINLYEPVLLAALGCVLAGTEPSNLNITRQRAEPLFRRLSGEELAPLLSQAADTLCGRMSCTDGLRRYIFLTLPHIEKRIRAGIRVGRPETVFPLPEQV